MDGLDGIYNNHSMLVTALQSTINPILPSFPIEAYKEDVAPPFSVHQIDGPEVLRDKEGITGYEHKVGVTVVSTTVLDATTRSNAVSAAVIALMNTTVDTTIIDGVFMLDESGVQHDSESNLYFNELNFEISTLNK